MKTRIQKITAETKEYFCNPNFYLFEESVKNDQKLKEQYAGREIYELIQNIDDAYDHESGRKCEAILSIEGDWLSVCNNGKPFTIETLRRLSYGGVSNKTGVIGCKGKGFRSILNWSDEFEIFSGWGDDYISVRFSRQYADEQFEALKNDAHFSAQVSNLKKRIAEVKYPIFRAPEYVTPIEKSFDTMIRIRVKDTQCMNRIRQSIADFDAHVLMFLPNVTRIIIQESGVPIRDISKSKVNANTVLVNSDGWKEYFLLEKCRRYLSEEYEGSREIEVAIALPVDMELTIDVNKLYAYFPIRDAQNPFNALIHATFCLTEDRDDLDMSTATLRRINGEIFRNVYEFYISCVLKHRDSSFRLRDAVPHGFNSRYVFPGQLQKLCAEQDYYEYCRGQHLFYSISGSYYNGDEEGLILIDDFPEFFAGENFQKLVRIDKEQSVKSFAYTLAETDEESSLIILSGIISGVSAYWDSQYRCMTLKWYLAKHIPTCKIPALLKNSEGNILANSETCFLPGTINKVPSWARISVLCDEDETALMSMFRSEIADEMSKRHDRDLKEESPQRVLPRFIPQLQEQSSRRNLISPVNASVGTDPVRANEFVVWLWGIWKEKRFDENLKSVDYKLPSAGGHVLPADMLYIGEEYGNNLGSELFSNIANMHKLMPGLIEDSADGMEVRMFFESLGVNCLPRFVNEQFNEIVLKDYKTEILESYIYQEVVGKIESPYNFKYKVSLTLVPHIQEILKKADCITILRWISADEELRLRLMFKLYEDDLASQLCYRKIQPGPKCYQKLESGRLSSYIRYLFAHVAWLKTVLNSAVAPYELLIHEESLLQEFGIKVISEKQISSLAAKAGVESSWLRTLLISLGTKESLLDLPSEQFYALLLKLPAVEGDDKVSKSMKLSREIYRTIIERGRDNKCPVHFLDCAAKRQFFAAGKLLVRLKSGKAAYRRLPEVCFSSSAIIHSGKLFPLYIPARSGNKDHFSAILGVKPFEMEYVVSEHKIARCNNDFKEDFKEFLPFLMTSRQGKKDAVASLELTLVFAVSVTMGNEKVNSGFNPYELFKISKNSWLIFIGDDCEYIQLDKIRLAGCIEQVMNVVLNFPSRDFLSRVMPLFIANNSQRKSIIMSEFGGYEEYMETDKELKGAETIKQEIKNAIHVDKDDINVSSIIDRIDWAELYSIESQGYIKELLQYIGKTTSWLSKKLSMNISIRNYNFASLDRAKLATDGLLKATIYKSLKEKPDQQETFIDIYRSFSRELQIPDEYLESLDFDAETIVKKAFISLIKSNVLKELPADEDSDKIREEYELAYQRNKRRLLNVKYGSEYINAFTQDPKIDSLLYFESATADIIQKFKNFISESEKELDSYDLHSDLIKILDNTSVSNKISSGSFHYPGFGQSYGDSAVNPSAQKKKLSGQIQRGDLAEFIAVMKLAEHEIAQIEHYLGRNYKVIWKSGASKRVAFDKFPSNVVQADQVSDSTGYDIELKSEHGIRMLIEVKSSTAEEVAFKMTRNEYRQALKYAKDPSAYYRIIFISGIPDKPRVTFLDEKFEHGPFQFDPALYQVIFKKE